MDEAIPHTAVRETYEETGYKSTIIALPNPSLTPGAREAVMNKEAIAVTLKVDRMSRPDKKSAQNRSARARDTTRSRGLRSTRCTSG